MINGVKETTEIVTLKIKIIEIQEEIKCFCHFNYDFLIGLGCIKNIKLIQDENLNILQNNIKIQK